MNRRGWWLLSFIWVFLVGMVAVILVGRPSSSRHPESHGFQPPEMAAVQFSVRPIHANLGGMSVAIPAHFANYVEYDGDPGFGEKRQGPPPVRTPKSKIRSFGFDVRYPGMEGLSSPEMWKDKRSYQGERLAEKPWISVGFNAGEIYPKDGFLNRQAEGAIGSGKRFPLENYEKLPDKENGLEVYALKGVDPKTGIPYRMHNMADDIFIDRDEYGKVLTFIKCSNRQVLAPPCTQYFDLEPFAKSVVYASYRRGLLPEWRKIQASIKGLVYSFKVE